MKWPKVVEILHKLVKSSGYKFPEKTEKNLYESLLNQFETKDLLENWLEQLENYANGVEKSVEKAKKLRSQGNDYFEVKNYSLSVAKYSESARCATIESDDFAIAIANRSAAFYHSGEYEKAIADSELALELNYPKAMSWKLHLRLAQCRLKLGEEKLAEEAIDKLRLFAAEGTELDGSLRASILKQADKLSETVSECRKSDEKLTNSKKAKDTFKPEDMLSPNPKFPFASKAIVRGQSPTSGRCIIAEKPIKKGDVLIVEKAYAWYPKKHVKSVSLCDHCFGSMDEALLPCRSCTDFFYCNASCWKNGWIYHRYECPGNVKGLWGQIGLTYLAFKILLASIMTEDRVFFNDAQKLLTNIDTTSNDDLLDHALTAWMITSYLENHTNFFETVDLKKSLADKFTDDTFNLNVDLSTRKGQKTCVGSLLIRYTLQAIINSFAIFKILLTNLTNDQDVVNVEQKRIAVGSFVSSAMLNHSCDASVKHSFWKDWIIVKAAKDIAQGEQLFISYGPDYKRMPKEERQAILQKLYGFHCECTACKNPHFDNYAMRFHGLKCPKCSGPTLFDVNRGKEHCLDCKTYSPAIERAILVRAAEMYNRGIDLSDAGRWNEAVPLFEKSLAIRQKYLCKHNDDIAMTHDALGKCYGCSGDWLKSIWYLEQSLTTIEERFGDSSSEVAHELAKITDICFEYLIDPKNLATQTFKEIYTKTQSFLDRNLEITCQSSGSWTKEYQEIMSSKERLEKIAEQRHVILQTLPKYRRPLSKLC